MHIVFLIGPLLSNNSMEEVKKHEPEYDSRKLFQSAEVGETLECIIP